MSTQLSADHVETPHPLSLPSSASQPGRGRGAKMQKGKLLLPSHSTARSLWLHLTSARKILFIEGSALGEISHTCKRVGRVLRPWSLAGGDARGREHGRFGVNVQLMIRLIEGLPCALGAAELRVPLWGRSGGASQRDWTSLHCPPLSSAFLCFATQGSEDVKGSKP